VKQHRAIAGAALASGGHRRQYRDADFTGAQLAVGR
jgi:hypothetical protein